MGVRYSNRLLTDFSYRRPPKESPATLNESSAAVLFQPLDAQLTALAALSYGGNALKVIRVNAGENGLELAAVSGGALSDGDYGDVTVSGSGTVMTIDNDAVSYAKIQNVSATDKLLGRSTAGAGDIEEITCTAAGRAILDDADAAAQRATLGAAATSHSHAQSDVTNLVSDLAAKMASTTTLDAIPVAVASVNINGQQLTSMRIENRTSDPGSPDAGQIWLRTDL